MTRPEPIDYARFREGSLDSWEDFYDWKIPYAENLYNLLQKSIALANEEIQLKVVIIYTLIPSALAKVVPYLNFHGLPGTGKTLAGYFISQVRGVPIHTSGDTFAAIRNSLESMKWKNDLERNSILVWDDIDPDVFITKPEMYRMFKVGYDRSSSVISIATSGGHNMKFNTFCPKVFGSISAIYANPLFEELQRRLMIVKTVKASSLNRDDLFDLQMVNWDGFHHLYNHFWEAEQHCELYSLVRKKLGKRKSANISSEKWLVSLDFMATGIVTGIFNDEKEAIKFMDNYWQWHDDLRYHQTGALHELLRSWINQELGKFEELRKGGISKGNLLNPEKLKRQIQAWNARGMIEQLITPKLLNKIMADLGFKLSSKGWVEIE